MTMYSVHLALLLLFNAIALSSYLESSRVTNPLEKRRAVSSTQSQISLRKLTWLSQLLECHGGEPHTRPNTWASHMLYRYHGSLWLICRAMGYYCNAADEVVASQPPVEMYLHPESEVFKTSCLASCRCHSDEFASEDVTCGYTSDDTVEGGIASSYSGIEGSSAANSRPHPGPAGVACSSSPAQSSASAPARPSPSPDPDDPPVQAPVFCDANLFGYPLDEDCRRLVQNVERSTIGYVTEGDMAEFFEPGAEAFTMTEDPNGRVALPYTYTEGMSDSHLIAAECSIHNKLRHSSHLP